MCTLTYAAVYLISFYSKNNALLFFSFVRKWRKDADGWCVAATSENDSEDEKIIPKAKIRLCGWK